MLNTKDIYHIPYDKSVNGHDIKLLVDSLGLSYDESRSIFRVSINTWTDITRDGLNSIVTNPTIALLAKYYSHHPERVPIMPSVSFTEVKEAVECSKNEHIGALLGKEKVSAHRWSNSGEKGSSFSPAVQLLANFLVVESRNGNLPEWEKMVEAEASLRGVDDIWSNVQWNTNYWKEQYKINTLCQTIYLVSEMIQDDLFLKNTNIEVFGFELSQREINKIVHDNYKKINKAFPKYHEYFKSNLHTPEDKAKKLVEFFAPYQT